MILDQMADPIGVRTGMVGPTSLWGLQLHRTLEKDTLNLDPKPDLDIKLLITTYQVENPHIDSA